MTTWTARSAPVARSPATGPGWYPPMSGPQTPVFHRYYDGAEPCPAFTARDAGCPARRHEAH